MALSKDRTLDRLEHISKSFKSKGDDCFDDYVVEACDSAIALINSTDVAEVEKLRARVLELEAERDSMELLNRQFQARGFAEKFGTPPEQSEPVAWMWRDDSGNWFASRRPRKTAQGNVVSDEPASIAYGARIELDKVVPLYAGCEQDI